MWREVHPVEGRIGSFSVMRKEEGEQWTSGWMPFLARDVDRKRAGAKMRNANAGNSAVQG